MNQYDLLVIGGGINGLGIAADAAARGLSVMIVEKGDWGGGTTSASSRLIHGGLRYLQYGEIDLVRESLHERGVLVRQRPPPRPSHLASDPDLLRHADTALDDRYWSGALRPFSPATPLFPSPVDPHRRQDPRPRTGPDHGAPHRGICLSGRTDRVPGAYLCGTDAGGHPGGRTGAEPHEGYLP